LQRSCFLKNCNWTALVFQFHNLIIPHTTPEVSGEFEEIELTELRQVVTASGLTRQSFGSMDDNSRSWMLTSHAVVPVEAIVVYRICTCSPPNLGRSRIVKNAATSLCSQCLGSEPEPFCFGVLVESADRPTWKSIYGRKDASSWGNVVG
jgi:hypothetical protein